MLCSWSLFLRSAKSEGIIWCNAPSHCFQTNLEKTADFLQHHHWFPNEMTSEKFRVTTDDISLPTSGYCFWLVVPYGKFTSANKKHYPDLASDASSVQNFLRSFLRCHWTGKPVVASQSVGSFLGLFSNQQVIIVATEVEEKVIISNSDLVFHLSYLACVQTL